MKNKFLYFSVLLLLVSTVIYISCSKSSGSSSGNNPPTPPVTTNTVSIVNMSFSAATLTVKAGTTVTWTNSDAMTHTVTADNASFDSGNIAPSGKFSKLFSTAGTYTYHCSIHSGMTGTIVVN